MTQKIWGLADTAGVSARPLLLGEKDLFRDQIGVL